MIKSHYFPEKTFATKEEFFTELRLNVDKIITVKTTEVYKSHEKGCPTVNFLFKDSNAASKVGPQMKDGYCYPITNTTLYLDSHDDVHLNGIWDVSVKSQQGKLFYVADHEIKTNTIIAWPSDVYTMVKSIPWSFVGKDYPGNTEGLIFEIDKAKIVHTVAKQIIDEKRPVQNSVRMQYVKIQLAINSDDKENVDYKMVWDKYIDSIVNKDIADERGYFFAVSEAKIIKECSMVPLGSNDATAIRQKADAVSSTSEKIEPENHSTQKESIFSKLKLQK